MATKYFSQLSLAEHFKDCRNFFETDTPTFFRTYEKHINLYDFIPSSFYSAFYKSLGRNRDYPLHGFLTALIFQKILSIPTDSLLIILLHLCKELRDFYGFSKVPDASKVTHFKQDFEPHFEQMFSAMVDYTEFKSNHPDISVEKKTASPDEDKSIGDSSALKPVLQDFFSAHPSFKPHT